MRVPSYPFLPPCQEGETRILDGKKYRSIVFLLIHISVQYYIVQDFYIKSHLGTVLQNDTRPRAQIWLPFYCHLCVFLWNARSSRSDMCQSEYLWTKKSLFLTPSQTAIGHKNQSKKFKNLFFGKQPQLHCISFQD